MTVNGDAQGVGLVLAGAFDGFLGTPEQRRSEAVTWELAHELAGAVRPCLTATDDEQERYNCVGCMPDADTMTACWVRMAREKVAKDEQQRAAAKGGEVQ